MEELLGKIEPEGTYSVGIMRTDYGFRQSPIDSFISSTLEHKMNIDAVQ
jgi:hypothetical protein